MINKIHHTTDINLAFCWLPHVPLIATPFNASKSSVIGEQLNEEVEGASDIVNRCTGVALRRDPLRLITRTWRSKGSYLWTHLARTRPMH